MSEDEKLPSWIAGLGLGGACLFVALMAQFKVFSSVIYNPPQTVLVLEQQILFFSFIIGNLLMAYGAIAYILYKTTPKLKVWDAKTEVRKWMENES